MRVRFRDEGHPSSVFLSSFFSSLSWRYLKVFLAHPRPVIADKKIKKNKIRAVKRVVSRDLYDLDLLFHSSSSSSFSCLFFSTLNSFYAFKFEQRSINRSFPHQYTCVDGYTCVFAGCCIS